MFSRLHVTQESGLLNVRFNRPERHNAFDLKMMEELEAFWMREASKKDLDCIILSADGEHFSVGGDIKELMDPAVLEEGGAARLIALSRRIVLNLLHVECPIVCAVQGVAAGLAANLALLADVLVLSDDARIGDTHVKIGLAPGDSGPVIWPLVMPISRAKEYLMLGEWVDAPEALRLGLTRNVTPRENLQSLSVDVARKFVGMPRLAVRAAKTAVNQIVLRRFVELMGFAGAAEEITFASTDHLRAREDFLKRSKDSSSSRNVT